MIFLKIILFLFLCSILNFKNVHGKCTFRIRNQSPLFIKNFGMRKIALKQNFDEITMENGESMQAHCTSSLSLKTDYREYVQNLQSINGIELYCNGSTRSFSTLDDVLPPKEIDRNTVYIGCENRLLRLYESKTTLPNCHEHYLTYAIGIVASNQANFVTAGICYDLDNLTPKFVNYVAYKPKYNFLEQKPSGSQSPTVGLDAELNGFNTLFQFMSEAEFNTTYAKKKSLTPLLAFLDYDLTNLIQDSELQSELVGFQNMLNIMWWRNLRLGNWHLFLDALVDRTQNVTYNVYTGTLGFVEFPTKNCQGIETLKVKTDVATITAPKYIWSYLQSTDEEFVIIALNSPVYSITNITFVCEDICHEIDWLIQTDFGRMHLMPHFGLVNCCRVEDVSPEFQDLPFKSRSVSETPTETTSMPAKQLKRTKPAKNKI